MKSLAFKKSLAFLSLVLAGEISYCVGVLYRNYNPLIQNKTQIQQQIPTPPVENQISQYPDYPDYNSWPFDNQVLPNPRNKEPEPDLIIAPYKIIKFDIDKPLEYRT